MDIQQLYSLYLKHPSVQTDTRKLQPGDVFFALSGPNFDGNVFAASALEKGAAYAVVDNPKYATNQQCILVDNTLETLQLLARHHRQQLAIPVIAITGSNGKTTTKELVASVLRQKFTTYATEGNLNNHIGVPLTLLRIRQDAQIAIIEMGANHQKEIASYCTIALPDYGIITNCGKAHIEGFGGVEGVRKGKGELYDYLRAHNGSIFVNQDLDYLQTMSTGIVKRVSYGTSNAQYNGTPEMSGVFLGVNIHGLADEMVINTQLVGDYNFPNVMVAVAVGLYFGVESQAIKQAIEAYSPDNSRSQWVNRGSNQVILDAYNANPTSMRAAISNFAASGLPGRILWIGAMKEMGEAEQAEHLELVQFINSHEWAQVILVGNEFKDVKGQYAWFASSADAAAFVQQHLPQGASILIKGSRGSRMELLLDVL